MSLPIALTRALVGLAQGVGLYLLYLAGDVKVWPATEPPLFAALLVTTVFAPVVVIAGLGNLRPRTLWAWALAAAAVCAGLAVYDILRDPLAASGATSGPRLMPAPLLWPSLAAVLFVVHALVVSGEADRRLVAGYPRLFDVSWKHGVQLALAVSFVCAFWALLWLSAGLFQLIGIGYPTVLIARPWFAAPATTAAFAYAVHATDARADLVRGVRTLALTLLAWLLPMMTAFAAAFLLALPFTGLEPLWATRYATATLLAAAAALIFLVNAAYQDGQDGEAVALAVRYARSLAALILVPLVALAAYGLALRAQQYGWTPQRIVAAACVVVASVLALLSPVADPARIAVADQIGRLETGRVTPERFDYRFLRFRSGRYGRAALERLAARTEGPHAAAIAQRAKQAMDLKSPYNSIGLVNATPASRAANIAVVYPPGRALPESFARHDWAAETKLRWRLPRCLLTDAKCEGVLIDLDGDGNAEILLLATISSQSGAFKAGPDGGWTLLGSIANVHCPGVRDAWTAGRLKPVAPLVKEIDANGVRLRVNYQQGCAR